MPTDRTPKIALVIGSGASKCLAAIPLLECLETLKVNIDLQVGCSGGAIISAFNGIGLTKESMRETLKQLFTSKLFELNYKTILKIPLPFLSYEHTDSIIKSDNFLKMYREMFNETRLEELKPKTIFVCTNFNTGERVLLEKGDLANAIYASGALVPFFKAIEINGMLLVDGGFSNPFPVIEAVRRDMDIIIAMSFYDSSKNSMNNFMEESQNFFKKMTSNFLYQQNALAINLHHYEIVHIPVIFENMISMNDNSALEQILETGAKAVDEYKHIIKSTIQNFNSFQNLNYVKEG